MQLRATSVLAAAILSLAPAAAHAQLVPYSQDFEGLVQAAPGALAADGWKVFGNVFDPAFNYLYGYGPFGAPNGGPAFSAIAAGQGGPAQGAQQLVAYSDYNNADHGAGNLVEANVFQEQIIGAGDVGSVWDFQFDAKRGDLQAPTTAIAFIKTLHPATFVLSTFLTLPTEGLPTTWGSFMISIPITAALSGHILQIGFASTATNYTPSGMIYDNISFAPGGPTPVEATSWGRVKALYR